MVINPSKTGAIVNDGDGYIFRNIGTISWNIFPSDLSNTVVIDGNTITSSAPYVLQSQQSLVLVYDESQSRLEGTTFTTLLPIGSSGAGGASGTSGQSSIAQYANKDTVTVNVGQGVHLNALDGYKAITTIPVRPVSMVMLQQ